MSEPKIPRKMENEEIEAFSMNLVKKYGLLVPVALGPGWVGVEKLVGKKIVLAGRLCRLNPMYAPTDSRSACFIFSDRTIYYQVDLVERNWRPLEFWADYFWAMSVSLANTPGMRNFLKDEKKVNEAYNAFFQMKEEQEAVDKFKEAKETYEKLKKDLPEMLERAITRGRLRT